MNPYGVTHISALRIVPGDVIVESFKRDNPLKPHRVVEVQSVERRRGCDGMHVTVKGSSYSQCYSRCADIPVVRHSDNLAEFVTILNAESVSFQ